MIAIENMSIQSGNFSLTGVDLAIPAGEYGVLMGRTGCGKTTVLEVICGLRRPDSGVVRLMGEDVTQLKAAERGIGYVPQDNALFRTMTVAENLSFALRVRNWPHDEIMDRVDELAVLLGIAHLLDRKAVGLSGGEVQRVALGRALAFRPNILCLDEPLSSLDRDTREEMYELLCAVREHTHVTAVHVTHDWEESRTLADRLYRFVDGRITEAVDFSPKAREGGAQ
jgi:ABC-type sugar transport system ATPase subunit